MDFSMCSPDPEHDSESDAEEWVVAYLVYFLEVSVWDERDKVFWGTYRLNGEEYNLGP
jgi:hypothetical protein